MSDHWSEQAGKELARLAERGGPWAYRHGGSASVEPTALAALALIAQGPGAAGLAAAASDWLATSQQTDGSLGTTPAQPTPGWPTPYAVLVWRALGAHAQATQKACRWLLAQKGKTLPREDDPGNVAGHDTTLVGWPWVSDTHSWLEPTALALLALNLTGHARHPRVIEGLALVRDRGVLGGGWNYGNRAVFGRALRPQPGPTGLALLALAALDGPSRQVDQAVAYLETALPGVRAPLSLGWGLLGLRAWGVHPGRADEWLAEAWAETTGRPDAAPRLATLILADARGGLRLFGCERSTVQPGPAAHEVPHD